MSSLQGQGLQTKAPSTPSQYTDTGSTRTKYTNMASTSLTTVPGREGKKWRGKERERETSTSTSKTLFVRPAAYRQSSLQAFYISDSKHEQKSKKKKKEKNAGKEKKKKRKIKQKRKMKT